MGYNPHCTTASALPGVDRPGWQPAQHLHRDIERRRQPYAVIVFPLFRGHLVWVRHPERGWELPGGKVQPGEDAEAAARREAWEEAGLRLGPLRWIAEYEVPGTGPTPFKWVYAAPVEDVGARPAMSEIVDVRVFRPTPTPSTIRRWPEASPIVQDDVYALVWQVLTSEGQLERGESVVS